VNIAEKYSKPNKVRAYSKQSQADKSVAHNVIVLGRRMEKKEGVDGQPDRKKYEKNNK
jgi:hypothetical protein